MSTRVFIDTQPATYIMHQRFDQQGLEQSNEYFELESGESRGKPQGAGPLMWAIIGVGLVCWGYALWSVFPA